jgi:citrate lyase subunit beta / citryl-CoA lyase
MQAGAIRSLLFVPGDSERKISKALASEADAVILDLEDAVAPEAKPAARRLVGEILGDADRQDKPVFVRLNAFDTGMTLMDLAAVMAGRPWGVVLPKCTDASDIERLSYALEALEAREDIPAGSTRILTVATETAAATLNLGRQSFAANARLFGMLWGSEDLAASLGAGSNRDEGGAYTFPYQLARSQCLYAAMALNAVAVDAVYTDFQDLAGLERETLQALRDGFRAKAAIHPGQVEVINRVMTPSAAEVSWATQVVALLDEVAVARLDGKMIDLAHKRIAESTLQRASSLRMSAAGPPRP